MGGKLFDVEELEAVGDQEAQEHERLGRGR
jgi:hypothetical protein